MAAKLWILFAAGASAQITTSFFMPPGGGLPSRLKYVASVVGADKDRLTLAVRPSNDTDYSDRLAIDFKQTFTFASTLLEYSTSNILEIAGEGSSSSYAYHMKCEIQTADSSADCTVSVGSSLATGQCNTQPQSGYTTTELWTFSDTDTTGVESVPWTVPALPGTIPIPEWCDDVRTGGVVPSSALESPIKVAREKFGTHTFIITAGEEKISATTGNAASTSTVKPTGSDSSSTGSATGDVKSTGTTSEFTGAAMPMRTMIPALAGLGAAVAAFF